MTMGPASTAFSIPSGFTNPAMNPMLIDIDEDLRISYFPTFAFNTELGDVNNFADDLDELIDIIDDPSQVDNISETLDRFNRILVDMGREGYIKTNFWLDAPLLPLMYRSDFFGGTFGLGLKTGAQIRAGVLDDTLAINPGSAQIETNTSVYLKSGIETTLSLSYGRQIFAKSQFLPDHGHLYAGVKLNVINLQLSKQIVPLTTLDGKDIDDVISDTYDQNLEKTTNIGVDLGFVWDAKHYRLGLTLENLNEPEFDYGSVGVNCESLGENNESRNQCEAATFFVQQGRLQANETHTKHALARVDGLVKITDRWMLSATYDLADYDDITGNENQWLHLATSYDPVNSVVPALRVGFQQNQVGSETSSITAGFTFFKLVSLDLEYGLESVEVDGSTVPRRVGFSLSVAESF